MNVANDFKKGMDEVAESTLTIPSDLLALLQNSGESASEELAIIDTCVTSLVSAYGQSMTFDFKVEDINNKAVSEISKAVQMVIEPIMKREKKKKIDELVAMVVVWAEKQLGLRNVRGDVTKDLCNAITSIVHTKMLELFAANAQKIKDREDIVRIAKGIEITDDIRDDLLKYAINHATVKTWWEKKRNVGFSRFGTDRFTKFRLPNPTRFFEIIREPNSELNQILSRAIGNDVNGNPDGQPQAPTMVLVWMDKQYTLIPPNCQPFKVFGFFP